jgi:signal transduction histidine kinase
LGFASVLLHKTLKSSTLKLAFIYVVVFCSAIFALLGYVYATTAAYLHQRFDSAIAVERRLLVTGFASGGRDRLVALIKQRMSDEFFNDWGYLVVDAASVYVAGNLTSWPASLNGAQGWGDFRSPESTPGSNGRRVLRVAYQVLPDGSHLLLGCDAGDLDRLGIRIATGLGTAAALFLALAVAAGISTSRRSVARIEVINATSRKIMQAGLGERIPLRGTRDEWDKLAENLNSMLARIEELTESTRQVADNVAHDLRTPLTRLRGRLEGALGRQADLAQYRVLVGDAIVELDGLLTTFSSLLRISRIEMRDRTAAFRRLDLAEIAREVVDLFDPTAEEAAVRLRLHDSGPAPVVGDRDLLFDAIANVIDNAIKHGGSGDEVTVAVERGRGGPVFSVADRGPGIPRDECNHVLRRFYRLERSRHSPGNGLGLSLVAAVANLHGARIEMADNAPGLKVALHFPDPDEGDPRDPEHQLNKQVPDAQHNPVA